MSTIKLDAVSAEAIAFEQSVSELSARLAQSGQTKDAKLVDDLLGRWQHTKCWYGTRHERLWHWAHAELNAEQKTRYFSIVANGTADMHEQPTYAQQFNTMKWRMEEAERKLAELAGCQNGQPLADACLPPSN